MKHEVHKNAKREQGQYSAILTELAWSIKDLLRIWHSMPPCCFVLLLLCLLASTPGWTSAKFYCMNKQIPSGQYRSILLARVANDSAGFDSSIYISILPWCFVRKGNIIMLIIRNLFLSRELNCG